MKEKRIIIILICLLVIAVGVGGFFTYKYFEKDDSESKNSSEKKEKTNNGGTETTDSELIKDLKKKVGFLFYTDSESQKQYSSVLDDSYIRISEDIGYELDLLKNLGFSADNKTVSVLNYLNKNTSKPTYDDIINNLENMYNLHFSGEADSFEKWAEKNDKTSDFRIIRKDDVVKLYSEIFEGDPKLEDMGYCPMYYYDQSKEVYIALYRCGGISETATTIYMSKFDVADDTAYVYLSVGFGGYINGDYKTVHYYNGIGDDKKELNNVDDLNSELKKNPDKFEQYKIEFKKDTDGKYKYSSIQKLEK